MRETRFLGNVKNDDDSERRNHSANLAAKKVKLRHPVMSVLRDGNGVFVRYKQRLSLLQAHEGVKTSNTE